MSAVDIRARQDVMGMDELQAEVIHVGTDVFGQASVSDFDERMLRFGEEAIELMQAGGISYGKFLQLGHHVYSRDAGEITQEIGGVGVTLFGVADAGDYSLGELTAIEIARVAGNKDKIRAKSALKPDHIFSTRSLI